MKDISVTLHQTCNLAQIVFETNYLTSKDDQLNKQLVKMFLTYLSLLQTKLESFLVFFGLFYRNNKSLVDNSVIEQKSRSHWLYMAGYMPLNNKYQVQNAIDYLKKIKETSRGLETKLKKLPERKKDKRDKFSEQYYRKIAETNDVFLTIKNMLKGIYIFGNGLECFVDDIIEEYFRDHVTLKILNRTPLDLFFGINNSSEYELTDEDFEI